MRKFFFDFIFFVVIIIISLLIILDPNLFQGFSLKNVHNDFCAKATNKVISNFQNIIVKKNLRPYLTVLFAKTI